MMPRRLRTATGLAFVGLLLGALGFAGYWAASGGRWYVVRTPSMGTAAPVGTLLWVKPADYASLHVGEMISFRPPGSSNVYSHRIEQVDPDGTLRTKGDANGIRDAWTLTKANVLGKVEMRWWGVGWLVRAGPILLFGGLLLAFVVPRLTPRRWHLPLAVVGAATLLSAAVLVYRPLVGAERVALLPTADGVRATYISTGLLPLRLSTAGGGQAYLHAGEIGTITNNRPASAGRLLVDLRPDIGWWLWAGIVLACFLPAVVSTVSGALRARGTAPAARRQEARHGV